MMPHTDTLEIVTSSQRYYNRIFNEIHNTLKTQSQINIRATLQPTKRRTNSLALHYKLYKLVPQKSKTTMNFTKPYKQPSTRLLNIIQLQTSYHYFLADPYLRITQFKTFLAIFPSLQTSSDTPKSSTLPKTRSYISTPLITAQEPIDHTQFQNAPRAPRQPTDNSTSIATNTPFNLSTQHLQVTTTNPITTSPSYCNLYPLRNTFLTAIKKSEYSNYHKTSLPANSNSRFDTKTSTI